MMTNRLKPHTLFLQYIVALLAVSFLLLTLGSGKAHAISDVFPDPATTGGDANAVVARVGGTYRLDATSVAFKIFIPTSYSGSVVKIAIHDACNNYQYGDYRTEFGLYTAPGAEEPISGPTQKFDTNNCSNTSNGSPGYVCSSYAENRCLSINTSQLTPSTVRGHENYYTLVLKADHKGTGGGINGFQVEVLSPSLGAFVTFRDLYQRDVWNGGGLTEVNSYSKPASFNSFAVLDQAFPGNGEDNYEFTFQAACDYTASTAFIKWSDADWASPPLPNEDGDISFQLINLSTGLPVSLRVYNESGTVLSSGTNNVSGNLIGGENEYRAARFNIQPNTNYRWAWRNVQDVNGVQLWMPFNEINQSQNCNASPTITAYPSCNAVTGSYKEPDGSTTIQARVSLEDGSNAVTVSVNVSASTSAKSYSITVPSSVKSASQRTRFQWVRIADSGGAGYVYASGFATDPLISCGVPIPEPKYDIKVVPVDPTTTTNSAPNTSVSASFTLLNQPNGHNSANGDSPSSPWIRIRQSNTYRDGSSFTFPIDIAGPVINSGDSFSRSVNIVIPPSAQVGDDYCVSLFVEAAWGLSDGSDYDKSRKEGPKKVCITVNNKPYLQAWGNDIWAGGGYDLDGSGTCTTGVGNITSVNETVTGVSFGALVEFGQYAGGSIVKFGSGGIANNSHKLTFANTEPIKGQFNANRCLSGFFDNGTGPNIDGGEINDGLWNNATNTNINTLSNGSSSSGQYKANSGNQIYNSSNFSGNGGGDVLKERFTILINGDLTIEKNIVMSESGWSGDGEDIPIMMFIVSGNIYISQDVERLDGIYISKKTIDTCAIGTNDDTFNEKLTINDCANHLEVNGKFIANNIAFRRTWGGTNEPRPGADSSRCDMGAGLLSSLSNDPSNPGTFYAGNINRRCSAETFRFNPALFLAKPILNYGGTGDPNNFPIQQIRDLPPVY